MKYKNIQKLSLQQIQIFLKCVQYKNYSRVAMEYNYSNSMISKTISALEMDLGLQLFTRNHNTLHPTPAARELAKSWEPIYNLVIQSLERANTIQEGYTANIRIGLLDTTHMASEYIQQKLKNTLNPVILNKIIWERKDMHSLGHLLEEDDFDLIITWIHEAECLNTDSILSKQIFHTKNAVFIHKSHPLFQKEIHSFVEFRPYPFLILSPALYPHYYQHLEGICHDHGFTPIVSYSVSDTNSLLYNLSLGRGQILADSTICDWETPDIKKIELENLGSSGLLVAWKRNTTNPNIKEIVDILSNQQKI